MLACYPSAARYDIASRLRHADLARLVPLVAVLCPEPLDEAPAGVHVGRVDAADPVRDGWCVVVLGVRQTVALTTRPAVLGSDDGPHDVAVTFKPDVVARAAYALLARLGAENEQASVQVVRSRRARRPRRCRPTCLSHAAA